MLEFLCEIKIHLFCSKIFPFYLTSPSLLIIVIKNNILTIKNKMGRRVSACRNKLWPKNLILCNNTLCVISQKILIGIYRINFAQCVLVSGGFYEEKKMFYGSQNSFLSCHVHCIDHLLWNWSMIFYHQIIEYLVWLLSACLSVFLTLMTKG